jgi:hypothetical protein
MADFLTVHIHVHAYMHVEYVNVRQTNDREGDRSAHQILALLPSKGCKDFIICFIYVCTLLFSVHRIWLQLSEPITAFKSPAVVNQRVL